jgi:hypothetical protein
MDFATSLACMNASDRAELITFCLYVVDRPAAASCIGGSWRDDDDDPARKQVDAAN